MRYRDIYLVRWKGKTFYEMPTTQNENKTLQTKLGQCDNRTTETLQSLLNRNKQSYHSYKGIRRRKWYYNRRKQIVIVGRNMIKALQTCRTRRRKLVSRMYSQLEVNVFTRQG